MTRVPDAGSIRLLLSGPSVLRTFALALVGRLAYGVLPLCFLFTVRGASGSFTVAAASSATFGLATLAMPIQSRLADRHGQRRVLPAYAACFVTLLCVSAALSRDVSLPAAWIGLGLLLGISGPALGPAMRAQWREIAAEGPQRRRAYSIDSVCEESLYLVGPLVAGVVLAVGPARVGLLVAAGLVTTGTAGLIASPHRPPAGAAVDLVERPPGGVLRPLLGLLVALSLFGAAGAATFVGVAALADRAGTPGVAGAVEAVMAVGAVVGGLLWARSGTSSSPGRPLALAFGCLALAQAAAAAVAHDLVLVGAVLAVGSLVTSPVYVLAFSQADALVPPDRRTEASTWVSVGSNLGTSAGTAVAGLLAGAGGGAPFLLGTGLCLAATLGAATGLLDHPRRG